MESEKQMKLDDILPLVGEFGKFQIILNIFLCILQFPGIMLIFLPYFSQHSPSWKCVQGSTVCTLNGTFDRTDANYDKRCDMARSEWEYTEVKEYSIVTEFDMVCDKDPYLHLATSLIFVSWAIGAIVLGWLSDRYGRKIATLACSVAVMVLGFSSAFSPNFAAYVTFRFLLGLFITGNIVYPFIFISEYVGTKWRPLVGMAVWLTSALSTLLLGVTAPYVRTWKALTITCTAPYIILVLFFKPFPESARWLILNGRKDEVQDILQRIARTNKKQLQEIRIADIDKEVKPGFKHFVRLFTPRKIAFRSLIQGFTWMVNGLVYYGVSYAADDLGGSMYMNFNVSTLAGIPAAVAFFYLSNRIGRKNTTLYPMLIAGISCISVSLISKKHNWARLLLGTIGKFAITISFDAIYTWSTELYPTEIRGAGMGYLQIAARIGSALAPWVAKWLLVFSKILPFALMGACSFVCGVLLYFLPETAHKKTAETIEDQFDDYEVNYNVNASISWIGSSIEMKADLKKAQELS